MVSCDTDTSPMEPRKRLQHKRTIVYHGGSAYDITDFLDKHPGGKDILVPHTGEDITMLMDDTGIHKHSKSAYSLLQTYKIPDNCKKRHQHDNVHENNEIHNTDGWKEELVDWQKPMLAQVHKLGSEYMKWVHSPVDFKLRLFESEFVEFFSKTPWYIIPVIWVPVVLYCTFLSVTNMKHIASKDELEFLTQKIGISPLLLLFSGLCLVFGTFVWSLIEYVLHRYLFHLTPPSDSPFWITLHFFLHGQHHKVPFDGDRLVFPPAAASVFAIFFYILITKLFPLGIGEGIFAGGLLGYVIYDLTHYYLHHGKPTKNSYLERLKQYHVAHHFEDFNKGFGISSKLWDLPFGTLP